MASRLSNINKKDILKMFFEKEVQDDALDDYSGYFEFFQEQIAHAKINKKTDMCQQIQDIVKVMQQYPDTTLPQLVARLNPPPSTPSTHDAVDFRVIVDCALRVWVGVNSRRPAFDDTLIKDGWGSFRWDDESSLCDFVWRVFYPGKKFGERPDPEREETSSETSTVQSKLTHPLTAVNLERYPKIGILWTPYLHGHLRFSSSYKELQVVEQKQWLQDAKSFLEKRGKQCRLGPGAGQWSQDGSMYKGEGGRELPPYPVPPEVLEEALLSLDYLFPNNNQTETFLKRHAKKLSIPEGERPRLKRFVYYHDRLIEVAQEFLNPPRNWSTIWSDNRNPIQFLIFWFGLLVVLLTLVLGIVASVLAGLQYGVARYPTSDAGPQ